MGLSPTGPVDRCCRLASSGPASVSGRLSAGVCPPRACPLRELRFCLRAPRPRLTSLTKTWSPTAVRPTASTLAQTGCSSNGRTCLSCEPRVRPRSHSGHTFFGVGGGVRFPRRLCEPYHNHEETPLGEQRLEGLGGEFARSVSSRSHCQALPPPTPPPAHARCHERPPQQIPSLDRSLFTRKRGRSRAGGVLTVASALYSLRERFVFYVALMPC